jgi:hypothetical protein
MGHLCRSPRCSFWRLSRCSWYPGSFCPSRTKQQLYTLELGRVHALLSVRNGPDEEHFEEAQALLKRVDDLGSRPQEEDQLVERLTIVLS